MVIAILFPLTIVGLFFFLVTMPNVFADGSYRFAAPFIVVLAILAAAFGRWHVRALNQGNQQHPPVRHMNRRVAFAVVLLVGAGAVSWFTATEAARLMGETTEDKLASTRRVIIEYQDQIKQLAEAAVTPRDHHELQMKRNYLASAQADLAKWEGMKSWLYGCIIASAVFGVASAWIAVRGVLQN